MLPRPDFHEPDDTASMFPRSLILSRLTGQCPDQLPIVNYKTVDETARPVKYLLQLKGNIGLSRARVMMITGCPWGNKATTLITLRGSHF